MAQKIAHLVSAAALVFASCGASLTDTRKPSKLEQTVVVVSETSEEDLVCGTEKPTGSNIVKRVCRSRALVEEQREEAERFVRRLQAPRPTPR